MGLPQNEVTTIVVLIVVFFAVRMLIGYLASRKVSSTSDYIVAGRRLPIYLTGASIMATWFAAETLMGASSTAYQYGFQGVVFDPFGAALCLLLSGFFFIRLMRRGRYLTAVDFFERRYGKGMAALVAGIQVIAYFAWTGAQIVAGGNIVHALLGWPVEAGMLLIAGVVITYTTLGGLWADTLLDFMQMFITAAGVTLIFVAVLIAVGGWERLTTDASSLYVSNALTMLPIEDEGYLGYLDHKSWFYWLAAWMSIGFGSLAAQDLMQRSVAARNESVSVWGSYSAGVLYLMFGIMSPLIGIAMFKLNANIAPEETEFLLVSAAMQHLNPILVALFIAALTSALMSTSDSSILCGASIVTENILPFFRPGMTYREKLVWTRVMVVAIGLISITIALWAGTIYKLSMVAWTVMLVGFAAPFAIGMYWKKANGWGAITSLLGGCLAWVIGIFIYFPSTMEACAGEFDMAFWDAVYISSTPAVGISVVLLIGVSLATQRYCKPMAVADVDGKPLDMRNRLGILRLRNGWGLPRMEQAAEEEEAAPQAV